MFVYVEVLLFYLSFVLFLFYIGNNQISTVENISIGVHFLFFLFFFFFFS